MRMMMIVMMRTETKTLLMLRTAAVMQPISVAMSNCVVFLLVVIIVNLGTVVVLIVRPRAYGYWC